MLYQAPPATAVVPLISGRVKGPLGIAHLPRLWLKLRLHALGRLPDGYRHGEGGNDGGVMDVLGIPCDALIEYVAREAPDEPSYEAWIRANATLPVNGPLVDDHNARILAFEMPQPRQDEWTQRFGLPEYKIASRLNELDDWDLVYKQIIDPGAPPAPVIPAISTSVTGPIGIAHLARVWLKKLLHLYGRLPEGYRCGIGGFDEMLLVDLLQIDNDTLTAFLDAERPSYLVTEAWVRDRAPHLTPAAIAAHNERLRTFEPNPERAAARRAEYGVDESVTTAVALNDLDDWLGLHRQLLAGA